MAVLDVDALSVRFETDDGVVQAVDGLSFDLEEREVLGIVGESGCGKSVSLMSLLRLLPPSAKIDGTARFGGIELLSASTRQIRRIRGRQIAFVFQEPMTSLNPSFRVGRQIAEVLERHLDLSRRAADRRAVELLDLVRIPAPDRRVREYPHQLSGGMRQRVMISIALACKPKLLIADEPTTALDVTIQAQILELMGDLGQRLGMSIMLITHDLGVVAEMCDDVVVMYAGRVVERGPVAHMFESPQHPYTEALLQSIPLLGMTQAEPLRVIRGTVPSPLDWPPGCRFEPRCDYAFDRCVEEHPPLFEVDDQQSACWLCEHGRRVPGIPQAVQAP
jgi:oligopeptide/dipeptide ABC transporter ATP-binding protein